MLLTSRTERVPVIAIASRCVTGVVVDCQCPPACGPRCDLIWTKLDKASPGDARPGSGPLTGAALEGK